MNDRPLPTADGCSVEHTGVAWDAIRVPHPTGLRVGVRSDARTTVSA